jgi:outer membrane protein TolC
MPPQNLPLVSMTSQRKAPSARKKPLPARKKAPPVRKKPLPAQKKLTPTPAQKEPQTTVPAPENSPPEKPLPENPLTLADILQNVEATHPRLRGAEADRQAATARRSARQGAFDVNLVAGTDAQRYNSTSTRGKVAEFYTNDAGAELTLRNGVKLYAGARLNAGAVKAPDSQTGTGGEYVAYVAVPLLRGLGINSRSASERQAILGEPLADERFRRTRLDTLAQAGNAYWEFVAAGQRLSVARELLRVSIIRLNATQKRADLGDLPRVDALEARQEVERRRGALTGAERSIQRAAFRLAQFRFAPDGTPLPILTERAVPRETALPTPIPVTLLEQEAARERALAARPEIPANQLEQRIVGVDRDLARNDRKPNVEFIFNPGADTGNLAIGNTFKTGLQFSLPLGQREARGRLSEANLRLQRLEQDALLLQTQIRLEVDDAVSSVNLSVRRYNAAVRELELARQVESRERDRLRLGEGTLFLLNQRERATAETASRVIDTRAEYFQAVLALELASARL